MKTRQKFSIENEQWITNQIVLFPKLTEIQSQRITKIIELGNRK